VVYPQPDRLCRWQVVNFRRAALAAARVRSGRR